MLTNDIATFLESQAVATEGTNLFRHDMPADPDTAICLYEYDAGAGDKFLDKPGLKVITRSKSADEARQKCQEIQNAICFKDLIINTTHYLIITPAGGADPLGRDSLGRYGFMQNFDVITERGE